MEKLSDSVKAPFPVNLSSGLEQWYRLMLDLTQQHFSDITANVASLAPSTQSCQQGSRFAFLHQSVVLLYSAVTHLA